MTTHADQRIHPRTKTLYKGKVVTDDRFCVMDCTVRDLSESGARIEFGSNFVPPPLFELEIPAKQLRFRAQRVWSSGLRLGVAFLGADSRREMASLSDDDAALVHQILEEARARIAEVVRTPPEQVTLTLDLPQTKE
jgi:hypothetical protein